MAAYKNDSSSNARSRQRSVDQIYLCGKVQSHTTLALAVVKGSTPEFMKDQLFHLPEMTRRAMEGGHSFDYMQTDKGFFSPE